MNRREARGQALRTAATALANLRANDPTLFVFEEREDESLALREATEEERKQIDRELRAIIEQLHARASRHGTP